MQKSQIVRAIVLGGFIITGVMAGTGAATADTAQDAATSSNAVGPDTREGSITATSPSAATALAPDGTRIWW
ncbi:hypothetical protein [Amycolatopsis sp. cmx-4-68]|uniref:hypothetical protein n=1 Tax=Amycolatopsis sp. cmx-4-68 TaxID=2790938 RepID=UPI0039798087